MIVTTTVIDDKHTKLVIDFRDEEINLIGETSIIGDESAALAYAPFFEQDLRRNNAELFPTPEPEEMPEEIFGGEE